MIDEKKIMISIIVPVYSGDDYLNELATRVNIIKIKWEEDNAPIELGELIFVDDNSIDKSALILNSLKSKYSWIHVLTLSSNFGQHPATIAGILHSSGDWIVTLDEDLQHPPEKIGDLLLMALEDKLDLVYASPVTGVHKNIRRDLASSMYKKIMVFLSGEKNISIYNSFRLIRGVIARSAASVCGHDTYFDVSMSWFSKNVGALKIDMEDIRYTKKYKSGYSFYKLLSHARRLLMSTHVKLYRIAAFFGIVIFLFGLIYSSIIFITELLHPGKYGSRGWPSLIITNMLFGGTSIVLLSIILEYISILVLRAQGKPVFFVINRLLSEKALNYLKQKNGNN